MKRYWRIWLSFLKASFIADLEYRANFSMRILTDIFWYLGQVAMFESLFHHSPNIGGWDIVKTRVFLGVLFVSDAIFVFLFEDNLHNVSEKVRKGEVDFLLTKPVNSQFILSTQRMNTAVIGNMILALGYFVWALVNYSDLHPLRLFWLFILIPVGVSIVYSVRFLMATASFFFTRAENLQYMWFQIYRLGLRPDSIYKPWLRYLCLTLIPISFIGSVPARFVVEEPSPLWALFGIFWAYMILRLTRWVWSRALSSYTSASS